MSIAANGTVICKSKYGATLQYATWIGDELKLPVVVPERMDARILSACDFLLIGSSVYVEKLLIRDWLRQNRTLLQNKRLFLFVVCATPSSEPEKQAGIIDQNIPKGLIAPEDIFFLPGRVVIQDLSLMDGLMIKIGARLEKDPVKKQVMLSGIDAVKKENISEILKSVRAFIAEPSPADMAGKGLLA
jgi:menaquinone-dependent protoporphyrinogen IX oxidase